MSLFLSKSLESYSSCYCVLNKNGKIIYYNSNFAKNFMIDDHVESKKFSDLLDTGIFEQKYMDKIQDSLTNIKENSFSLISSTNNSQTMRNIRIIPLERPFGIFVMKIITVEIIRTKK
jgi:nitrogen-specific signal transduction histidine kinase